MTGKCALTNTSWGDCRIKAEFNSLARPHSGVIYRLLHLVANPTPSCWGFIQPEPASISYTTAGEGHPLLRLLRMNTHIQGWHAVACALLACTLAGCSSVPSDMPGMSGMPKMPTMPEGVPKDFESLGAEGGASGEGGGVMGYLGDLGKKALEATGLKKPSVPELPKVPDSALPDRRIAWRIHASPSLNVTAQGQSLALLTRIYRLRSPDAFLQATADTFGDAAKEKEVLGDDLVSVREVQLVPGQQYETSEKMPREVRYVGIVGLFRAPATQRWRYAFSTASAERSGLNLGAHACAITVQAGEPIGQPLKVVRSAAVTCP